MKRLDLDPVELYPPDPPSRPSRFFRPAFSRNRTTGVGCLTLLAIFFVSVTAFGLAYQARPSYSIDLGGQLDRPFLDNFNDRETVTQDRQDGSKETITYRWSKDTSYINLPGIGSQPLSVTLRYTPSNNPTNTLTILVDQKNQAQLSPPTNDNGWLTTSFLVPANWFPDGHLHLILKNPAFTPAGDNRQLGLAIDSITVIPLNNPPLTGFIRPPDSVFLALLFAVVLAVLIFLSIGMPVIMALAGGLLLIAGFTYWLVADRLSLTTLLEREFVRTLFFMWVIAYLVAEYLPRLFRMLGLSTSRRDGGWLAGLFLLQFTVLYFVQLHPLFSTSDLGLNIHKVLSVQGGQWVFSEALPGGLPAPYPPAFYVLLQPFTLLSGSDNSQLGNLIMLVNSILTASGVFLVYYLAALLRAPMTYELQYRGSEVRVRSGQFNALSSDWAALIAAAFYSVNRYQFFVFSQGNHANLFGSWAFLFFLCVIAGTLNYLRYPRPQVTPVAAGAKSDKGRFSLERLFDYWQQNLRPRASRVLLYSMPAALLLLVFLSHYGTFLFTNLFMLTYIVVMAVLGGKTYRQETIYLALIWLVSLMLAIALYYYNFFGLLSGQLSGGGSEKRGTLDPIAALRGFYASCRDNFGLIVGLAALGGLALWITGRLDKPKTQWWRLGPVGAALLALTLTSLAFALAETIQPESRYQLYFVTALVIPAGYLLGRVWRTGWAGRTLVIGLFLFQFLSALLFWLSRMPIYY